MSSSSPSPFHNIILSYYKISIALQTAIVNVADVNNKSNFAFLFIIINEDVITTSTPSPIEQTEAKENAYYDFWNLE